ncbi:ribonuclease J [Terrarubrum flagellatum]|uniref:ribonuclease J n=1 Tax=Terrirubrum flagellatum TaxID=2895980 RepID=UPI0031455B19
MDELVFAPLGGLGEIGMNAALYGFGPQGRKKWILVDCGVSFAGDDLPGVDLVLPDLSFIEEERKNLLGIVITHAHEDHIGAVVDLWPRLHAPIYATKFAANLLEIRKLNEPNAPKLPITRVAPGKPFNLGPFSCEFINVAHSIPESNALALKTSLGTIVHTGDWKIDETPIVGQPTDETRLRALGDEGVLALICDSTNVVRDGISPSESDVARSLRDIIQNSKNRVAVTTFASNVARMRAVAEAAEAAGRQVCVVGRAMDRVVEVSRELGLLDGLKPFLGADAAQRLPRNKVVALLTGSQGEPRAAMARIAFGDHPDLSLAGGDRVIFSSRAIPGNEKGVNRIINELVKNDVEVITDRTHLVHVSGHPRRDELKRMYEWVRPQIAIPAHGEALHLTEHAAFAKAQGVPNVVRAFNGAMVRLAPGKAEIIDHVRAGRRLKDGELLIDVADPTIGERRKLSFVGIVTIAIAISGKGEVVTEPEIALMGLPPRSKNGVDMVDLVGDVVDQTLEGLPRQRRRSAETVEKAVERAVRGAVNQAWGKKPVCHVLVLEV